MAKKGRYFGFFKATKQTVLFCVLLGILLMAIVFFFAAKLDRNNAEYSIEEGMVNLRHQCESYDELTAADKVKSLIRLTEQAEELAKRLKIDPNGLRDDYICDYMYDQRISGVIIFDENLKPMYEFSDEKKSPKITESIAANAIKDICTYRQKVYCKRLEINETYCDMAFVSRLDSEGVVCCYKLQENDALEFGQGLMKELMTDNGGMHNAITKTIFRRERIIHLSGGLQKKDDTINKKLIAAMKKAPGRENIKKLRVLGVTYYAKKENYSDYGLYIFIPEKRFLRFRILLTVGFAALYLIATLIIFIIRYVMDKRHTQELNVWAQNIKSISSIYSIAILFDIDNDTFDVLNAPPWIKKMSKQHISARGLIDAISRHYVSNSYREIYKKYTDLTNADKMLRNRDYFEYIYRDAAGEWFRNIFIANQRTQVGHICTAILVTRSIDDQKKTELDYQTRLERTMRDAVRANNAKTDFLRRMSHDVRTPINIIMGMVKIGDRFAQDMKKQQYCREKVWAASSLLLDLVNDVLFINKMDSGIFELEKRAFSISDIFDETANIAIIQAEEKNITVTKHNAKIHNEVLIGSPLHVRQILMNIFGNAVKYTKRGGKIELMCEQVQARNNKAVIKFVCRDNGIGMGEKFQKHMFDSFAQEKKSEDEFSGIGLGLAIVKKLVDKMCGHISVESKKNIGTCFTITIPFDIDFSAVSPEDSVKKLNLPAAAPLSGVSILLAEDNALNMEIAVFMLEDMGAKVTKAENGEKVFSIWQNSPTGTFDVILMDLMMPVLGGVAATELIRKNNREDAGTIPVIALSANVFDDDREHCLKVGMNDFVAKPLDRGKLERVVLRYVNERRQNK